MEITYAMVDIYRLRSEMKRLVPIIIDSKKKVRDPILNEATMTCPTFKYSSQKGFYFEGDDARTHKRNTHIKAYMTWRNSTGRFTRLCAFLAYLRGKKHFSANSNVGKLSDKKFVEWLKPEIEEFSIV